MDRVRFGRALGGGARDAARALIKAADAATAPQPAAPTTRSPASAGRAPAAGNPAKRTGQGRLVQDRVVQERVAQVRAASGGLRRGSKRFGEAVWAPVVKVSGVVWLEVTGVLFSLFAITAALYLWQHRGDLHSTGTPRQNLLLASAMLALFGFFTVSSFVRARHRSRR